MEWQNYPEFFLGIKEAAGSHQMAKARPEEKVVSR